MRSMLAHLGNRHRIWSGGVRSVIPLDILGDFPAVMGGVLLLFLGKWMIYRPLQLYLSGGNERLV